MASFPDTPATLLARIAVQATGQPDEAAWLRFFELYAPAIRKFAAGLGARDESEDVAQEIFLKLVDVLRQGCYRADAGKFRLEEWPPGRPVKQKGGAGTPALLLQHGLLH